MHFDGKAYFDRYLNKIHGKLVLAMIIFSSGFPMACFKSPAPVKSSGFCLV